MTTPPMLVPPGHYYSPIVDPKDVADYAAAYRAVSPLTGVEIDLGAMGVQFGKMMEALQHNGLEIKKDRDPALRYFAANSFFPYGDAVCLASLLLEKQPKRVIEVGSGFSSAVLLDTADRMKRRPNITFIEPNPDDRLHKLLRETDRANVKLIVSPIQLVDLSEFDSLEAGDFLFLDTTHVVKTGSDVLHELFCIFPRLKPGVIIHFHDVFERFEYPDKWINEGRSWNELYFLRAFLTGNRNYRVLFFVDYFTKHAPEIVESAAPKAHKFYGGSLWLEKLS
jgi:predicted O-methyltransferase YrrM